MNEGMAEARVSRAACRAARQAGGQLREAEHREGPAHSLYRSQKSEGLSWASSSADGCAGPRQSAANDRPNAGGIADAACANALRSYSKRMGRSTFLR